MMMEELILMWFSMCLLFLVPVTRGQAIQLPPTHDNGAILARLSNLETIFIEERLKTVSLKNELAEIKSRLDVLSSCPGKADDELTKSYVAEIMTNALDTIQDGLVSEKQQRLRLEMMALEIKGIVDKQNQNIKLLEEKANLLENGLKALGQKGSNQVPTIAQRNPTTSPGRPTALSPSSPPEQTTTTINPSQPIVGRVKFSGQPLNQYDNRMAKDCKHIEEFGYSRVGVYLVYIRPDNPVLLYCWYNGRMLAQWRRGEGDGRQQIIHDFNKTWDEYKYGFGSFDSDFWIGNEILWHVINSSSSDRILEISERNHPNTYAWHSVKTFNTQLTNERKGYQLHYSRYKTSLHYFFEDQIPGNGYTFMKSDKQSRGSNCPDIDGCWWYQRSPGCKVTPSNPNSRFTNVTHPSLRTHHPGYYSYQASRHNLRTTVTATRVLLDYRNRN